MSRCSACNSQFTPNKKKPVTTWSGEMNSVFADKIEDFPVKDKEDLCNSCIASIRNMNSDLTVGGRYFEVADLFKSHLREGEGRGVDVYTDNLDAEYLESENVYQGYDSYESMEGTSYSLGERDY